MFTEQRTATGSLIAARNDHQVRSETIQGILRRYYTVWGAYAIASGFLYGVYPIFLHTRGLNQFEINSVLAVYFTVTFLTDVPTGAFADALGRRRSFMLGCSLRALAFLVYFFAWHYPMFLLGEFIDGIGTTFCNGSIDAWGVDALDEAGYVGAKDRLFQRASQVLGAGFIISALIGGYVADWNIAWPWLLGAVGYLFNAVVIARMMHDSPHRQIAIRLAQIPGVVAKRVTAGIRRGFRMRTLMLLCVANAVYFAAWAPYWLEWPQFFNQRYGAGVWVVGWLYALFTLSRMLGSEIMIWTTTDSHEARANRLCFLAVALAGLMYTGGSLGRQTAETLVAFCFLNACMGALLPFTQSWINEEIGPDERATLLSFRSTFETLGGSIGLLSTGVVADRAGLQAAWRFAGVLSLAALPCYLALRATKTAPLAAQPVVR